MVDHTSASHQDQLFFLYLATTNIHHPFTLAPPAAQLFDLEKDPFQSENVVTQNPEVKQELQQLLAEYRA